MTGSDLIVADASGRVLLAATGELYDLNSLADAAALVEILERLERGARDVRRQAQQRLRDELAREGRTDLLVGDYQVSEAAGRPSFDAHQLHADLAAAGLDAARLEELFVTEVRVADARELGKLANRHQAYAEAIEKNRTRSRGRLQVKRKGAALVAPRPTEAHRDRAHQLAESEAAARERGI